MPATRVRYVVLAFAFALSVITYIDRVCIAAAPPALVGSSCTQTISRARPWCFIFCAKAAATGMGYR